MVKLEVDKKISKQYHDFYKELKKDHNITHVEYLEAIILHALKSKDQIRTYFAY